MKNFILVVVAVGFVSLGFTLAKKGQVSKFNEDQQMVKMDFSHKLDEKRLASWD